MPSLPSGQLVIHTSSAPFGFIAGSSAVILDSRPVGTFIKSGTVLHVAIPSSAGPGPGGRGAGRDRHGEPSTPAARRGLPVCANPAVSPSRGGPRPGTPAGPSHR